MTMHSKALARGLLTTLAALSVSCGDAPLDRNADGGYPNHNFPAGRIEGTILYEGPPPPLDANGRPRGRIILTLFHSNNPPPPDGFATTAESLQTLPASQLFVNLTVTGGSRVRASAPFVFPNITTAGEYQIRAFYSREDDPQGFHPLFSVRNQPTREDVGGGAVLDPTAPVPRFATIPVGALQGGRLVMPPDGAVTRGVTVFLGVVFTEDRPVFHVPASPAPVNLAVSTISATEALPMALSARPDMASRTGFLGAGSRVLVLPSNLPAGTPDDVTALAGALPQIPIQVSVPSNELNGARAAGVMFDPELLRFTFGPMYRAEHPTLLPILAPNMPPRRFPWNFPLAILVKLHEPTTEERALFAQSNPDPIDLARALAALNQPEHTPGRAPVVLFGAVTASGDLRELFSPVAPMTSARVTISPIAVEIRGPTEADQVPIVPKVPPGIANLLGMLRSNFQCSDAGLPAGRYGLTLVTARGQTWTVPNELAPSAFARGAYAPSQGVVVRIDRTNAPAGFACPRAM